MTAGVRQARHPVNPGSQVVDLARARVESQVVDRRLLATGAHPTSGRVIGYGSQTPHPQVNQARVDLAASQARADQVASRARAVDPQVHHLVSQVMTGEVGAQIHPRVNLARADPAVVNLASQEALLALQEIGEVGRLVQLLPQERAARVDQDVNLVRAVRAVAPQVRQMIKDGESHVRVGVPRRPLVNPARAAVVRARVERVEVDLVQVEIGASQTVGVDGPQAHHPAVNLERATAAGYNFPRWG